MYEGIKYLVVDVDGTMTDSGIYYDEDGNEIKKFSTKDAAGFFAAKEVGIEIIIVTGRVCNATLRRMNDLKVSYLFQNINNKYVFLKSYMLENDIKKENIGYIGDDLNDLEAMQLVSYIGCPADSCDEVKELACYVSHKNGGHGAVRDVIENLLKIRNQWNQAIKVMYRSRN